MPNRLAGESSPYLLQHADNPVDWRPWGAEAWEMAREEDRPVLLSIGYSACHWCHVMEHESFADPSTAAVMNELFVNIKVDREERPDIDQIYMRALQAATGSGGWPLTAFLTPQGKPYHLGTYYPPSPRMGMPAFRQVLLAAAQAYRERRSDVLALGERMIEAIAGDPVARSGSGGSVDATDEIILRALGASCRELERRFDPTHGGFGHAPKFPPSLTIELLLRQHLRTGDPDALHMCVHTLRRMAAGGIQDHLGGGFHRYSVDERWLVPHFEKMLYDNALLALAYLDAFRVAGHEDLRAVAQSTLDYIASDLRSPEGGFYAARDADTEGEEGTYYLWRSEEVRSIVGDDFDLFSRTYGVSRAGNFEGKNILHLASGPSFPVGDGGSFSVGDGGLNGEATREVLARSRRKLLLARSERSAPFRDEKVVACWAALAVRAFAEAGATLGRTDYVRIGLEGARFLWHELRRDGVLARTWTGGRLGVHGFLSDYGALGNALLSVHAATLDPVWLERAVLVADEVILRFGDEDRPGVYFDSAAAGEELVVRPRGVLDGATPSGSSLTAEFFARLAAPSGTDGYLRRARAIVGRVGSALPTLGPALGRMLSAADRLIAEPVEVVIVTESDPSRAGEVRASPGSAGASVAGGLAEPARASDEVGPSAETALVRAAFSVPRRNLAVIGSRVGAPPFNPLAEGRGTIEGLPTAYVCRNRVCGMPVTDPESLRTEIAG